MTLFVRLSLLSLFVLTLFTAGTYAQPKAGVTNPDVEMRGVWLNWRELLEGKEATLALLDRLQDATINTIFVNTQFRGCVIYPGSQFYPQYPDFVEKDPNVLDWLIPAVHERGMAIQAWTEYGFFGYWTKDPKTDKSMGPVLEKYPQLLSCDSEGHPWVENQFGRYYSLCPSNPGSHNIMIKLDLEMMDKYAFDGLNLDRIRYQSANHCFCDYCKRAFEADTGLPLKPYDPESWEGHILLQWRYDKLTDFVKRLSGRFHNKYPDRELTAALVPFYFNFEKAQDWPTWLRKRYLDAAVPMCYLKDITGEMKRAKDAFGPGAPVYFGLDCTNGVELVRKQIQQLRDDGWHGFVFWEASLLDPLLPELKKDVLAKPAKAPVLRPHVQKKAATK